jgi:hypothetical protein
MAVRGRKSADDALVLALAAGATMADAAEQAGVSERTAFRRMQDAPFRQQVVITRTRFYEQAVGLLADSLTDAVRTLRALLEADSESTRLGAARTILEAGPRLRESEELAERIAALEAHLEPADEPASRDRARWSA